VKKHSPEPISPASARPAEEAAASDWSASEANLVAKLGSHPLGLTDTEARLRLQRHGPNRLAGAPRSGALALLLRPFASPILVILLGAAILSFLLDSPTDGLIIVAIVTVSALLGFWQERRAHAASTCFCSGRWPIPSCSPWPWGMG
jgi:Mg2+-importing ATPase